jgi:hypothetical protein
MALMDDSHVSGLVSGSYGEGGKVRYGNMGDCEIGDGK